MFTPRRYVRALSLEVGLSLATLVLVNSASAINFKALAQKATSPYAVEIKELHATKVLLEQADHDYKGHRAAAVKEITVAIHALEGTHHAHHHPHKGTGGNHEPQVSCGALPARSFDPHKGTGGNHEPQQTSDAQLKQAILQLKVIQGQLVNAPGIEPAKAVIAIDKAIKQLEIALEIR